VIGRRRSMTGWMRDGSAWRRIDDMSGVVWRLIAGR
jgi:hypothetical protein